MKRIYGIFSLLALISCFIGISINALAKEKKSKIACNSLTVQEKAEGWQLLFDGKKIDQWHGFNKENVPEGWIIKDNCLMFLGKGGDSGGGIVTNREFVNFELKLEWRVSAGGNSGIFYGVVEDPKYKTPYFTGPEYQLLDDIGFPASLEDHQLTGANYAMYAANKTKKKLQMIGNNEFNTSMIVVNGNHIEHWLNGEKILEFDRWTDDWNKRKNEGKWKDYPDYGKFKKGKIGLQDHRSCIWFRNIKIREL
jgi:hypothetical protein